MKKFIERITNWNREVKIGFLVVLSCLIIFGSIAAAIGLNSHPGEDPGAGIIPPLDSLPDGQVDVKIEDYIFKKPVKNEMGVTKATSFFDVNNANIDGVIKTKDSKYYCSLGIVYKGDAPFRAYTALPGKVVATANSSLIFAGKSVTIISDTGLLLTYEGLASTTLKVGDSILADDVVGQSGSSTFYDKPNILYFTVRLPQQKLTSIPSSLDFEKYSKTTSYVDGEKCFDKQVKNINL